jgi:hypothetical protein
MKISDSFLDMSPQQLVDNYVSSRIPIAMFSTEDAKVDLGINQTATRWGAEDIEILQDFYRASISSLYNETEYLQDTIRTIGDRQFIVFEFVGRVVDESAATGTSTFSKYNYIQYTLYKGKVLLFNFNCSIRMQRQWQPVAKEMMESVRIK